jgi:hypothetical protein
MSQMAKMFLQLDGPSFDELLEIVTSTNAKGNTSKKQLLSGSICPLH